jgi:hypothetical protein
MSDCNNLTIYYNPSEAKTSVTDLTSISTDVIKKQIIQHNFQLYNKSGNSVGNIFALNNLTIYESTPNITNIIASTIFSINNCDFIEKYSTLTSNTDERNSRGLLINNQTRFNNLTSVEGNASYSKLRWILPISADGIQQTRILTFYN